MVGETNERDAPAGTRKTSFTHFTETAADSSLVDLRGPRELRAARQASTEVASSLDTGHGADLLLAWGRLERRSGAIQALIFRLGSELSDCARDCAALGAAAQQAAHVGGGSFSRLAQLSPQQVRALHLAANGRTDCEIAGELHVSRQTVKSHLREAYRKLGVHSRSAAVSHLLGPPPNGGIFSQ